MGKTLLGGTTRGEDISLISPQQQQFLTQASEGFSTFGQQTPEQTQDIFNKSVVDPSMKAFEQQILPAVQQRFVDANAGSSSALNQALSQAATGLTTDLGAQYGNFYNQQQQNQLQGLSGLSGLGSQQNFQPLITQQQGVLGPILQALSPLLTGGL